MLLIFVHRPTGHGLGPIKRLWQYLVRQESVQKHFVKFIFGKSNVKGGLFSADLCGGVIPDSQSYVSDSGAADDLPDGGHAQLAKMQQPVKVIHKEHDAITAFCINKVTCPHLQSCLPHYFETHCVYTSF